MKNLKKNILTNVRHGIDKFMNILKIIQKRFSSKAHAILFQENKMTLNTNSNIQENQEQPSAKRSLN